NVRREYKVHSRAQAPPISGMAGVEHLNRLRRDVSDFDELRLVIIPVGSVSEHIARMIHNFTDYERTYKRSGVHGTESRRALGRVSDSTRQELRIDLIATEGHTIRSGTKIEPCSIT